jgi:hypothetical protein
VPLKPPRTPQHRRVVRHLKTAPVGAVTLGNPPPPPEIQQSGPATLGPTVVPVASVGSSSSSTLLPILLGVGLGLSLLVVSIAVTPPWVLPRGVGAIVYDRRDSLVYAGIATALSIGVGLLIIFAS